MPKPIPLLTPQTGYTLAIDESGQVFRPGGNGRLVGVLGTGAMLPADFHAVQSSPGKRQRFLQYLLGKDDLGVLGLDGSQLPFLPGDQWLGGVLHLTSWALLMLPVAPAWREARHACCKLTVLVEQRGGSRAGELWPGAVQLMRERLARVDPVRARIGVDLVVVAKGAHPLLAAADLLAHTWNGGERAAFGLAESGLLGTCLFEGAQHDLPRCMEIALRKEVGDGESWRWVLSQPGAQTPGTPAAVALERLGDRLDSLQWTRLVEAASRHLDGGSVNLGAAQQEAAWLEASRPEGVEVPPAVELSLETGRLALENHRGENAVTRIEAKIGALSDRLFEEYPSLVCLADLHLASQATNRFEFEGAQERLSRWQSLPLAVGGLRMRARVESSHGQHLAFLGDLDAATRRLLRALELIERLTDPAQVQRERAQTATYLAIVSIDRSDLTDEVVGERVRAVTGPVHLVLEGKGSVWGHYLALRWLVHRTSDPGLVRYYLGLRGGWPRGEHHPWPIIEAYRALLLRPVDPKGALERLSCGQALALRHEVGPVLWLQGAAMAAVARQWGRRWDGLEEQLEVIEEELPKARTHIEFLRRALSQSMEPLEILKGALPFNFR